MIECQVVNSHLIRDMEAQYRTLEKAEKVCPLLIDFFELDIVSQVLIEVAYRRGREAEVKGCGILGTFELAMTEILIWATRFMAGYRLNS